MKRFALSPRSLLPALLCASTLFLPNAGAAAGSSHWTRVNGHRLYYLLAGSGAPVLLLHGGGDSGEHSFAKQIDELVDAGYRVIAPDQVGQGRTPDLPGPLSYRAMTEDTATLLRQLDLGPVNVVGFSDGGILGLMLAVRYPDLVNRMAVSGVNISPTGLRQVDRDALEAQSRSAAQTGDATSLEAKLRELWLHEPSEEDLSTDLLGRISKPVLVIAGDRDLIRLEHVITIYHALPNARLFIVPDTGHGTFDTRPDLVNPVLMEFLGQS
jgi:pimeloyl-ACP methyl ester carboxylesterase